MTPARPRLSSAALAALLGACLPACGGSVEAAKGAGPRPDLGAPEVPWGSKTREQRMGYMGAYVLPRMRKLFTELDPGFASFSCETCHGADAEIVDWEMPNSLYALPEKGWMEDAMGMDEETAKFMVAKVVPAMAELLREPASSDGVSCFTCHPRE